MTFLIPIDFPLMVAQQIAVATDQNSRRESTNSEITREVAAGVRIKRQTAHSNALKYGLGHRNTTTILVDCNDRKALGW